MPWYILNTIALKYVITYLITKNVSNTLYILYLKDFHIFHCCRKVVWKWWVFSVVASPLQYESVFEEVVNLEPNHSEGVQYWHFGLRSAKKTNVITSLTNLRANIQSGNINHWPFLISRANTRRRGGPAKCTHRFNSIHWSDKEPLHSFNR